MILDVRRHGAPSPVGDVDPAAGRDRGAVDGRKALLAVNQIIDWETEAAGRYALANDLLLAGGSVRIRFLTRNARRIVDQTGCLPIAANGGNPFFLRINGVEVANCPSANSAVESKPGRIPC